MIQGESQPSPKSDFVPISIFIKPFWKASVIIETLFLFEPEKLILLCLVFSIGETEYVTLRLSAILATSFNIRLGIITRVPDKTAILAESTQFLRIDSNIGTVPIDDISLSVPIIDIISFLI